MNTPSQDILDAFKQLPDLEKHALASEILKQIAILDVSPLTDEALTAVADGLFVEHDKTESADAETKTRRSLAD